MVDPAAITTPGPKRAMSRPATTNENSGTINGPGAMARPVVSADQCYTSCAHSTRESSIAPNAAEKKSATAEAPVKGRSRKSARSMSGLRACSVCRTNAATATTPAPSAATVRGSPHPQPAPLTSPSTSAATPPVTSAAPSSSGLGTGWPGTSGSRRQPIASAASPIGTLTKNTQRQLAATSRPPTTGPSAAARPPTAVHALTAPWRRSAEQHEQRRVDDRVRVEHPREVGRRIAAKVEVPPHLRQRDVDDEQVEAGEHDGGADDHENLTL